MRRIDSTEYLFVTDFPSSWQDCEMDCPIAPRVDGSLPEIAEDHNGRGAAWLVLGVLLLSFWAGIAIVTLGRLHMLEVLP